MASKLLTLSRQHIEKRILFLRNERVILDVDLANLYGVETRALLQSVKRNSARFPLDFMFRLSANEYNFLRSQFVISSRSHGGRRYMPYVFTEHGAIMAANVLRSKRAVDASIYVVRAFVKLREVILANRELAEKVAELEKKFSSHDGAIREIIEAIRRLMAPPVEKKKRPIGFRTADSTD